jgi:hypothetical protein
VTAGVRKLQDRGGGGTSTRTSSWLAWSLAALSVVMFVASIVLHILTHSSQEATGAGDTLGELLIYSSFLAFPIVGALIASKHPNNPVGWICLAVGLLWMLIFLEDAISGLGPYSVTMDALTQADWIPPIGLLGIYLFLLFPDGKLPSRRWRPLAWFSGVVMVLASLGITFAPGPLEDNPGVRNPFGLEGAPWLAHAVFIVLLLFPLCMLASALSLVMRYRRSGGVERVQIKWIAFAASAVGLLYLIAMVGSFTYLGPWGSPGTPLWLTLLQNAALVSFVAVPVAVGFAVLRYRLYDIDVVINRTLVYGSLTAMLAAVYFGGVTATQTIFRILTGQEQQPQLAIVFSTLVIAALFNPLRRRIQSFIDRRFYRRKYDAAKTLEAFSAKLRDETDLDALSDDLVGVVKETMQPAHVSLWLRPDTASKGKQAD